MLYEGTAVAQWLRYCATNQKVAGSIPDGVVEFFIDINPSDRTMALGSTQPPTEMSTRSISRG
jgi:membrane-bound lytic murein transglycosylase B